MGAYGVYIYSWPVSQLVWFEGRNAYINTLLATLVIFPVSFLSWKYVEKPALSLRRYLSRSRVPSADTTSGEVTHVELVTFKNS